MSEITKSGRLVEAWVIDGGQRKRIYLGDNKAEAKAAIAQWDAAQAKPSDEPKPAPKRKPKPKADAE